MKSFVRGFFLIFLFSAPFLSAAQCNDCVYDWSGRWCRECRPGVLKEAQPPGCCGVFGGAEFLYWVACENDLDYVQIKENISNPEIGPGDLKFADYDGSAGFRIFVGYKFGCDGWDARFVYTNINFKGSDHQETSNAPTATNALGPVHLHPDGAALFSGENEFIGYAKARVGLDYHTYDVLFSRPFCVSQTFLARPMFGFRALQMDRDFKATYKETKDGVKAAIMDWDSDYTGYGLHAGLEASMRLRTLCSDHVALNFFAGGSLVVGETDEHHKQFAEGAESTAPIDVKEEQCIGVPGYHLGTSLSWESTCCNLFTLVSVGYEFNHWFNLPQPRRYMESVQAGNDHIVKTPSSTHGNVLLHGLTIRGELHF